MNDLHIEHYREGRVPEHVANQCAEAAMRAFGRDGKFKQEALEHLTGLVTVGLLWR